MMYDRLAYGKVSPVHVDLFKRAVNGKVVYDLGCGDGARALQALSLGAKEVVAIDKSAPHISTIKAWQEHPITFIKSYFEGFDLEVAKEAVAMLFYPANYHMAGLTCLLERFDQVLYFGLNNNGTMCGHTALFKHLMSRELLDSSDVVTGAMLHYGALQRMEAVPRCEEELRWESLINYSSTLNTTGMF